MKPRSPRTTGRGFSSSSLIASAAIHGGLVLGVVAVGTWGYKSESAQHVYHLAFDQAVVAQVAADPIEPEALEALDEKAALDIDPELEPQVRPVPVHYQPDPERFVEPGRQAVLPPGMPDTREFVFGPRVQEVVEAPAEITPVEPAPQVEPPEPSAPQTESPAEPVAVEYVRLDGDEPEYPRASVRLGEEGDVVLALKVDDEGLVVSVELRASSNHRRLDQAAMTAALSWRFPKGTPSTIQHTIHFRLSH